MKKYWIIFAIIILFYSNLFSKESDSKHLFFIPNHGQIQDSSVKYYINDNKNYILFRNNSISIINQGLIDSNNSNYIKTDIEISSTQNTYINTQVPKLIKYKFYTSKCKKGITIDTVFSSISYSCSNGNLSLRFEIRNNKLYFFEPTNKLLSLKLNKFKRIYINDSVYFVQNGIKIIDKHLNVKQDQTLDGESDNIKEIVWSRYFGGSDGDNLSIVKCDKYGNIYIGGFSYSINLPTTDNAYQENNNGNLDIFVCKLDSKGDVLWCTYIGGESQDIISGMCIDNKNSVSCVGETTSHFFPVSDNAPQKQFAGGSGDGIFVKFDRDGNLLFSTYLGSSSYDSFDDCVADSKNNTWLIGRTCGNDYHILNSVHNYSGNYDIVICKFSDNNDLLLSTYWGGEQNDFAEGIIVDNKDNVIITGFTISQLYPTLNPYQPNNAGNYDAYITKFDNNLNVLWSTYFGGKNYDCGCDITCDNNDNIIIVGYTFSNDLNVSNNAPQAALNGASDYFFLKLSSNGELEKSSYWGSSSSEGMVVIYSQFGSITTDNNGNLYFIGNTKGNDFPVSSDALQKDLRGVQDIILSSFDNDLNLKYSSYIGQQSYNYGLDLSIDNNNKALYIVGRTDNGFFPVKNTMEGQNYYGGSLDGFITKFYITDCNAVKSDVDTIKLGEKSCINDTTVTITITNTGTAKADITATYFFNKNTKFDLGYGGGFSLDPSAKRQLTINIKPDASGTLNDTLYIDVSNGCTSLIQIPIIGTLNKYSLTTDVKDTLDFGVICSLIDKDASLIITNTSNLKSKLNFSYLPAPFFISGDPLKSALNINESRKIKIKFYSSTPGTFYQTLYIIDTCGNTKKIILKAESESPSIDLGNDVSICENDSVEIGVKPVGGTAPYTYRWSPKSGLTDSKTEFTKASPDTTTTYQLIVTDKNGCTFSDKIKVTVFKNVQTKITGDINVCSGIEYLYYAVPEGISNHWNISGAKSVDSTNSNILKIVWADNSEGKIKLVQKFSKLCSDSAELTINISSNVDISLNDTIACLNVPYTITPKLIGKQKNISEISWTPSLYLSSTTILNPVFQTSIPGSYKYYLKITNKNGCIANASININVPDTVNLTLNKDSIDFGNLDACVSIKDDSLKITNNSAYTVKVSKYDVNSDFTIISPAIPFSLNTSESKTIIVRYNSNHTGQSQYPIVLHGDPCDWSKSIQCTGNKDNSFFSLDPNMINFGSDLSCFDITKDTSVIIKNTSKSSLNIALSKAI